MGAAIRLDYFVGVVRIRLGLSTIEDGLCFRRRFVWWTAAHDETWIVEGVNVHGQIQASIGFDGICVVVRSSVPDDAVACLRFIATRRQFRSIIDAGLSSFYSREARSFLRGLESQILYGSRRR